MKVVITHIRKKLPILCLKDRTDKVLTESWYSEKSKDPDDEIRRIVTTAASLLRDRNTGGLNAVPKLLDLFTNDELTADSKVAVAPRHPGRALLVCTRIVCHRLPLTRMSHGWEGKVDRFAASQYPCLPALTTAPQQRAGAEVLRGTEKIGDPRENPPSCGMIPARFPHARTEVTPPRIRPGSPWWEVSVRNKHCYLCKRAERQNVPANTHVCYKNWDNNRPSAAMEQALL
ncbi:hypothetical protein PR048_032253 [Dryococelus australis]|uniref:Mutator-like transposase domain-containing protein n=1 Tax=Dryococelus australis TaxID=614101 RepID=A0ABQ9G1Q0_9NEOP|nr:hypothetical protein PR048_032253 [Dryococelus australis]